MVDLHFKKNQDSIKNIAMRILTCLLLTSTPLLAVSTVTPGSTTDIISTNSNNFDPQLAFNTTGNGVAAWVRTQVTSLGTTSLQPNLILASLYTASTSSWEATPTQIGNGSLPVVGIDGSNNAFVVFVQNSNIQVVRYNASTSTWDATPTVLSSSNVNTDPFLTVNSNGVAAVVWSTTVTSLGTNNQQTSIQMAAYDGTNWSSVVTLVEPTVANFVGQPQVAIDNTAIGSGVNGQVIWQNTSSNTTTPGQITTIPIIITTS